MARQRKTHPRKTKLLGRTTAIKHTRRHKPETLRLRGTSPKLTVSDLPASIRWYTEILGFIVGDEWRDGGALKGVQLKAGAAEWLLDQDDFAKGRDRKKGEGVRFYCRTIQDVGHIAERVSAHGGHLDEGPAATPWGTRSISLTDPDGYKITLESQV